MRFSYENLRPFTRDDFMPFAGATPAPGHPAEVEWTAINRAKYGPWIGSVWVEDDKGPTNWTIILGGADHDPKVWVLALIPLPQVQDRLKLNELQLVVKGGYDQKDRMTQIAYILQSFNESGNAAAIAALEVLGFKRI